MATNTTNYDFKKPDESDFYDVADQNKNWDLADEALKNLDTPTFEDYTGSTAVPSATDAIDQIKSKGKLGTLLSNIKAAFKGACLIGHIVNNCVTDNAGLPLSAAQGKVLKDLYTQLYSEVGNKALKSHTHDDRYYTETEINTKLTNIQKQCNADIGLTITKNSTNIKNGDIWGKRSGKTTSIGFVDFAIETKVNMVRWTRYPLCTADCKMTTGHGVLVNQDNGTCYVLEIDSGDKTIYLKVENTVLTAGTWLRGQIVFMCWE